MAIADARSDVERRRAPSVPAVLVALGGMLSVLIGLGVAWKATVDARGQYARNRFLEIETANYRAATTTLAEQIKSLEVTPVVEAAFGESSESARPEHITERAVLRDSPAPSTPAPPGGPLQDWDVPTGVAPVLPAVIAEGPIAVVEAHGPMSDAPEASPVEPKTFVEAVAEARTTPAQLSDSRRNELARSADAPAESAAVTADVENRIRVVIAQYLEGLENQDLVALKKVWPSLDANQEQALRTEFRNARKIQALLAESRITINGDTATVTGVRIYALETTDGQRLFSTTRTMITMRRTGDAWVIERVAHVQ